MTDILVIDFIIVLMIFLRVMAAFVASPVFGHKALPVQLKVVLSLAISLIIFFTIDTSKLNIQPNLYFMFFNGIKEVVTGLLIGFMLNIVFYGLNFAGTLIGFDMGLSMAEIFNPSTETNSNVIGEIIYIGAILIFFVIDGHHYVIRSLAYSFKIVPIGAFKLNSALYTLIIQYTAQVFVIAIKISAPILVSFFLVHIAEGILARAIPQMQVFFVTQPLKLGMGFLLLASIAPIYVYVIKNLLKTSEDSLLNVIKAMGS